MSSFIKFLPHALIIGILAGLMQLLDLSSNGNFVAWIGFASWACYFLAGCTLSGGRKVTLCWLAGMIAAVAIIELGTNLTNTFNNAKIGFPLAVGAIAFVVILFEKVNFLNMIPAWFIGAACFFGINNFLNGEYEKSIPALVISLFVGQIFGIVTVFLRGKYANCCENNVPTKK